MEKLTNEQRFQVIKHYYQNAKSLDETVVALVPIFGRNTCPTKETVRAVVNKLETTFSLLDEDLPVKKGNERSVGVVKASLRDERSPEIPSEKDLGLKPYKIKLPASSKSKQRNKRKVTKEPEEGKALESSEQEKVEKAKETSDSSSESKPAAREETKSRSKKPKVKTDGE